MMQVNASGPERGAVVHVIPELQDLIPMFMERRYQDVEVVSEAQQCGDYETIWKVGHNMKGTGAAYGFDLVTDIGCKLEEAASRQDAAQVQSLMEELAAYLQHVVVVYE